MKKIFTIILVAMLGFFSTGCDHYLDVNKNIDAPDEQQLPDYLYLAGVESALQGLYWDIRATGPMTQMFATSSYTGFCNYYWTPSDSGGEMWRVVYWLQGKNLENMIRDALPSVVKAIGDDNLMKVGVGLTTYFATKLVAKDGIKVAISGQGADELFGGYKRYLQNFVDGSLNWTLREDMSNMYHVNLERDDACSMLNSVELRLPFLDKKLVELVLNMTDKKKIVSMHEKKKKSILRKIAFEEGLDYEIAYRPKKAAQYGTGIDKILRKKIVRDTDISQYLN